MAGTRRSRKGKKATKRPDMSNIREALKDQRVWGCVGVVQAADDGGSHFDLDGENLTVEVEFQPSGESVTAVVASVAAGFGSGVWKVPAVGTEVLVMIPDGELDFQPTVVAVTSSGTMPEGVSETVMVIATNPGGEVLVHDGTGTTKALAFKDELEAQVNEYNAHIHQDITTAPTSPPIAAGSILPNPGFNPMLPPTPAGGGNPTDLPGTPTSGALPVGTAVLKAK